MPRHKGQGGIHDNVTKSVAECESSIQILQAKNGETGGIAAGTLATENEDYEKRAWT